MVMIQIHEKTTIGSQLTSLQLQFYFDDTAHNDIRFGPSAFVSIKVTAGSDDFYIHYIGTNNSQISPTCCSGVDPHIKIHQYALHIRLECLRVLFNICTINFKITNRYQEMQISRRIENINKQKNSFTTLYFFLSFHILSREEY